MLEWYSTAVFEHGKHYALDFGEGKYGQVIDELDTSWSDFVDCVRDAAQVVRHPAVKDEHYWIRRCG